MVIWQFTLRTDSILAQSPAKMQSTIPAGKNGIVKQLVISPNYVVDT